jgi:hypothetical protein
MTKTLLLASALLIQGAAQTAFAASVTLMPGGENHEIIFEAAPRGNVVGGGLTMLSGNGDSLTIQHLDPRFEQRGAPSGFLAELVRPQQGGQG